MCINIDRIPYGHGIENSKFLAIHTALRNVNGFKNLITNIHLLTKKDQIKYHKTK